MRSFTSVQMFHTHTHTGFTGQQRKLSCLNVGWRLAGAAPNSALSGEDSAVGNQVAGLVLSEATDIANTFKTS